MSQCQLGSGFTHCIQAWVRIRCCISRKWKNADVKHRIVDWSRPGQGVLTAGSFGPFCSSGRFWLFSGRLLLKYEVICVWTVDHPGVQIYAGIMNFPLLMLLTAARWLNGQKNAHNQVYRASALVLPKGRKQRPRRMMNWSLILSYVKKLSMLSFWGTLHCQWTHPPEPHESALCCSELHSDSTVTQVCTNTGSCSRYVIYCNSTKTVILRFLLLEVSKEFFSWFDVTDLWYLFVWKF